MSHDQAGAVSSWDHSVVPVVDLWRAERFYTEILDGAIFQKVGMTFRHEDTSRSGATFIDPPGAFVKLGRHHLGLFLQRETPVYPADAVGDAYPCWALTVAAEDIPDILARFKDSGSTIGPEQLERYGEMSWRTIRCTDSEGNCLELVADDRGRYHNRMVTGLSPMHFETVDLPGTVEFYTHTLGMPVLDSSPDHAAFESGDGQGLVFHRVARLSPSSVGPYHGRHFAFTVEPEAFHAIVSRLRAAAIEEGDALGRAIPGELDSYFSDPVNNSLWLQIQNKDSEQSAAGRARLKYAAA